MKKKSNGKRFSPDVEKMIRNLLVSAFEGGSKYWYRVDSYKLPSGTTWKDFQEGGRMQPEGDYFHPLELIPTFPGGSLIIRDISEGEGDTYVLDLSALKRAWRLMEEKFPEHYGRIRAENDDANEGDMFLQLATFGDVIYG